MQEEMYQAIGETQSFMHKKTPNDAIMKAIRDHYPSPQYFVESDRKCLERFGLPRLDAFYYAMIPALTRTVLSQQWGVHSRMNTLDSMREFLKSLYIGLHVECFYLIMLNRQAKLIRPVLLQRGEQDNAPFYLRQLLTVAIREDARFLVLAHNHPGGTKRPSNEDLKCTLRALEAFAPLRIPLLDHLIVAGDDVVSIRETGLLPAILWTAAQPNSKIVNGWLNNNLNNS